MTVRRVLSLLPREETLPSIKANFDTAVSKGRYKLVIPTATTDEEETEEGEEI